jgi:AAA ATPase domain
LIGRERERQALHRLLDGVRRGRGGVLVIHGDAGVGKTALLEYAAEAGRGFRIARTAGVQAEMELYVEAISRLAPARPGPGYLVKSACAHGRRARGDPSSPGSDELSGPRPRVRVLCLSGPGARRA